jgi:hypothetical protein
MDVWGMRDPESRQVAQLNCLLYPGEMAAKTCGECKICMKPNTARTLSHIKMTGPKSPPTLAVPRR